MQPNSRYGLVSLRTMWLGSVSVFSLAMFSTAAIAQSVSDGSGRVSNLVIGKNTELGTNAEDPGAMGFSISLDGERLAGDNTPVDKVRQTDVDLSKVDIQVKFDGLGVTPILNVSTDDLRSSYRGGDVVNFLASTNYPDWIERAEVLIYDATVPGRGTPYDIVNFKDTEGKAAWKMPQDGSKKYTYVLRVYDQTGRYDETLPLSLQRTSADFETHETNPKQPAVAAGKGEDRTAVRNIPVYGGAVTVFGRDVPVGYKVHAIGENVPIDENGAFVVQRILPPGDHAVDVRVQGREDGRVDFSRDINIPENEWYYVGLADVTVGNGPGSEKVIEKANGQYESVYNKGRLAFYLKGKIKGRYLLTASADTGEDGIDDLFNNMDEKDPRQLLRRVDPDKYYPVYGDDSTAFEDAPTAGKFYVRVDRGDSHVMWGNYKSTIRGTEFARHERAMYGGRAHYRSENTTAHGARTVEVEAFGSQPDTMPQRDNLRGTGGSVYFLTYQDINNGSEQITVEVRDSVSNVVLSRRQLRYGEDYEINYVQGVVILKQPLASTARSDTLVQDGTLGGNRQSLVVQYEYTPTLSDVDGYSYGGRAQVWLNNNIRIGATGIKEETGAADQLIAEADLHIRLGANSYAEAEIARSEGPGFGEDYSINGGLTINEDLTSGRRDHPAYAYRARLNIDFQDLNLDLNGAVGAYFERRDEGFSSIGYNTDTTQQSYGAFARVEVNKYFSYELKYDDFQDDNGTKKREGSADTEISLTDKWTLGLGAKYTHLYRTEGKDQNGDRVDVAARLAYKRNEDQTYYLFGQTTAHRSGNIERNDRVGVGMETKLTEKIGVSGEVSYGTLGWGGLAAVNYHPTADDHYYVGYKLDPDRTYGFDDVFQGTDYGGFVVGARRRYSDDLSAYIENSYDLFGERESLTSTYGVTYTPATAWVINGAFEYGDVKDDYSTDLERIAVSGSVNYNNPEGMSWRLKGETRFEDSEQDEQDRNTYLASTGFSFKQNENWRLVGNIDAAISDSDQSSILDGDYIEASIGYAYRPVDNDRVNALFKYGYLYDLPGPDQVTVDDESFGYAQRSHILSADGIYDVNQYLSVGAKYGFRIGQVSESRLATDFVDSSAHLGVVRGDFHVVKNWDVLLEGRVLYTPEIDTTNYGALAGVYRHVGNNLKVGVGYNFGKFSDNVADLSQDDDGWFLNVIGKI